uniref:COMM domain containing 6 n=1 Tax=Nannospalax galili TaxID=1026970 RepID=A0A8C6QFL8_NANGA
MEVSPSSDPVLDAKSEVTNQKSLKYPYVAVKLTVADHFGQVKTKSFEMTIPQFQNFYRQFKEIAAVIETV